MQNESRFSWPNWLLINDETWKSSRLAGVLNGTLALCFLSAFWGHESVIIAPLSSLFAVTFLRIGLSFIHSKYLTRIPNRQASGWDAVLIAITTLSGFFWSWAIYRALSFQEEPMIVLIAQGTLFALISASTLSLGKTKFLFALHAFPLMIGESWFLLNHSNSPQVLILSLGAIGTFTTFVFYQQQIFYETWRHSEQQAKELRAVLESIPGGVSLIENGRYVFVNEYVQTLTGLTWNEFDGRKVGFVYPDSPLAKMVNQFYNLPDDQLMSEVSLGPPGREKCFLLIMKKLPTDSHQRLLMLTLDIEEKKRLEKQAEAQKTQMVAASKFAALGEMAAGICHEINNPLAVITSVSDIMHRRAKDSLGVSTYSEKDLKDLERIKSTGFRIAKIIQGLKSFSRNAQLDPKIRTSLDQVIRDSLSLCEGRLKKNGVELRLNVTPSLAIMCRPAEITQVLLNAINNALDSMESVPTAKWIEIEAVQDFGAQRIRICIRDSGPGIPLEIRERLMTPFFTTKEVGKGTGLGLSISKGIIESHQGHFYFNFEAANTELVIDLPTPTPLAA